MPNHGAVTGSITTSGGSYTIPAGYHNGSGKVTGPTLAALVGTSVTLTSNANLLTGNTAYGKNGTKYTGSMANKGAWTNTPTTKGKVTIPAGYHNGSGYVDTTSVYNAGFNLGNASGKLEITLSGTLKHEITATNTSSPGGPFDYWATQSSKPVSITLEIIIENGIIITKNITSVETATNDSTPNVYNRACLTALTITSINWTKTN